MPTFDKRLRDRYDAMARDTRPWRERAACREHPSPDWWFGGDQGDRADPRAIEICRRCPVREPCIDYATRHRQSGYWGSTQTERRRWAKRSA